MNYTLDTIDNCYIGDNDSIWLSAKQMKELTNYDLKKITDYLESRKFEEQIINNISIYPFHTCSLLVESLI